MFVGNKIRRERGTKYSLRTQATANNSTVKTFAARPRLHNDIERVNEFGPELYARYIGSAS